MSATLCLFSCVLVTAQPPERPEWSGAPRLNRAQELLYRGTISEEAAGSAVQFQRGYRFEARLFVLDANPQGAEVALLTVLRHKEARGGSDQPAGAVRLEVGRIEAGGKVILPGGTPRVPLDGPPTFETGMLMTPPAFTNRGDRTWREEEIGRPGRDWKVVGQELFQGTTCLKIVGVQQSDGWGLPRADRAAWQRRDTVWFSPRLGAALRVDRVIERREAGRTDAAQRLTLSYDLISTLDYPGQLFEERKREIQQARRFADDAAMLVPHGSKHAAQLDALLGRIQYQLEKSPTPYREAILLVKRRVEQARRGEVPPALVNEDPATPTATTVGVGRLAPDFLVTDFTGSESGRLGRWAGKTLVLVFYHPQASGSPDLLRFAQGLQDAFGPHGAAVVGLSVLEDAAVVRRQRTELKLTFPVLDGAGLKSSYGVEGTPKFVVIDARGTVRGHYLGWGASTSAEVTQELRRALLR